MKRALLIAVPLALAAGVAAYWLTSRPGKDNDAEERSAATVLLSDVTRAAGIGFRHDAGATGDKLNPETFGPGAGWLDYDADGHIDLLLVNGNSLRGPSSESSTPVLYRNLGDGTFRDVTRAAGLAVPLYGMGFISADVDNDGDQDLLLYGLHRSLFFLNEDGTFRDHTATSGLSAMRGWVGAATFLDYDRDGRLDLFVGNYVEWHPELEDNLDCTYGGSAKRYCPVAYFNATHPQLFRGGGDGTFTETTRDAGLATLKAKALGVVVEDYNRDGYPDIFVASDSVPNLLLRNRGDGTFVDRGTDSGFATDAAGVALAGMGIDTDWGPDDGPLRIGIGNFSGEPTTLHVQEAVDYLVEQSFPLGIAAPSINKVTFGLVLFDYDLDGVVDMATANGHVANMEKLTAVRYRQPLQVFLGREGAPFELAAGAGAKPVLGDDVIGRALAAADYDQDGDIDLVLTENQGSARLLRNDYAGPKRFVRVRVRGTVSNRDAIGAEVTLRTRRSGGEHTARRTRKSASSYLSQSEPELVFGLRPGEEPLEVDVRWPNGKHERFAPVALGRTIVLVEGQGRAGASPGPVAKVAPGVGHVETRRRGVQLYHDRRYSEAAKVLVAAVATEPHDFVAQRFLLLALNAAGDAAGVEKRIREITRLFPSVNLVVSRFALVIRELGQPRLAERLFHEALRLDPKRVDVWLAVGDLAYDRGAFGEALENYQRVLALNAESLSALTNIGKIRTIRKEYAVARRYLEKALRLRPDYATALSTLGGVLMEQGDLAAAEEKLLQARDGAQRTGDNNTLLSVYGNLGILYFKRRDRPRAIEAFEKVLELKPNDRQARAALERLRR